MGTIRVRRNGPYLIDADDVGLVDWNGEAYPVDRRPVALCRCGASRRKPFCDGSHKTIDFQAEESASTRPPDPTP